MAIIHQFAYLRPANVNLSHVACKVHLAVDFRVHISRRIYQFASELAVECQFSKVK